MNRSILSEKFEDELSKEKKKKKNKIKKSYDAQKGILRQYTGFAILHSRQGLNLVY